MSKEREWFDFVLVERDIKYRLYRAPAFSGLSIGDKVLIEEYTDSEEYAGREEYGIVKSVVTLDSEDTDKIDFIMKATKSNTDVPKVLAKVSLDRLEYDGD